jgi:hypothetical protein
MEKKEFLINFTDITLNETDGVFKEVEKIMKKESIDKKWVVRSVVTIASMGGEGVLEIQCHADGKVYILDYIPSIGELFYNPDIQVLCAWCQEHGWQIPQPHPDLVKTHKEFWKHFYDTLLIDSDYLDKLYGVRPQLQKDIDKKGK